MPITTAAFVVAALSIAGFPGFNGFVSKGMIIAQAHKKHIDVVWYLLLAGGVGTFLSFIKLGWYAFYEGNYDGQVRDANRLQQVAMVSVAVLCVAYGLFPDALFAILPGNEGGFDYTTYTFGHIVEGLVLAALGIVGFAILKKPLDRVGRVPDIDTVYNPLTFYATRGLVRGVTETYAAVDRAAVATTAGVSRTLRNPETVVRRVAGRPEADATGEEESAWPLSLHAGIGTSILLLVAVTTVGIALLVVA
jgi:multicomponent Na+:H+ antiporter subunit D